MNVSIAILPEVHLREERIVGLSLDDLSLLYQVSPHLVNMEHNHHESHNTVKVTILIIRY